MESIEEFNDRRLKEIYNKEKELNYNNIECPKCGGEMVDSNPGVFLTSNPPQMDIHCPKCFHRAYRFA